MAIQIEGRIDFDSTSVDQATESVADLNENLEKTGNLGDNVAKDLKQNFDTVKASADLLGGSVSTVVGGLALLGVENQYIENLTQGAAGALAFASGIDRLGKGLVGFAKNTKVAAVAQRIFNAVLAANPVVLIATALIGLGAAIASLTLFTKDNTAAEQENAAAREKQLELIDKTRQAEKRLARERASSRLEQLKLDLEDEQERINRLNGIIAFLEAREAAYGQRVTNLLINARQQLNTFEVERQILLERIEKEEKRLAKEAQDRRDKEEQDIKNKEEKITEFIQKSALDRELAQLDSIEREKKQLELQFAEQIKLAGDNIELRLQLEQEYENRKAEIDKRINQEILNQQEELREQLNLDLLDDLDFRFNAIEEQYDKELELAAGNAELIKIIEEKKAAKIKELNDEIALNEAQLQALRVDLAGQSALAIGDLLQTLAGENEDRARKAFAINKALNIADATANTFVGATTVLRDPTIPTPAKPFAVASIITAGLAQVARIAATKFETASASASSAAAAPSVGAAAQPATPQFNLFGQDTSPTTGPGASQLNNQQFAGSGSFNGTLRAVVVESDITSTQDRLDLIKRGAEL